MCSYVRMWLVEYGTSRKCRGASGSGKEDCGIPAWRKLTGRMWGVHCLSRVSAASCYPMHPGKLSMGSRSTQEEGSEGEKEGTNT